MTQFSQERITVHLDNLKQQVVFMEKYRDMKLNEFQKNEERVYAVFHAFQIAIQNVMDVAAHILSSLFHEHYDEYKQLLPMLEQHKVLPTDFVKRSSGVAEFRNKLVHGYLSVDPEKVHGYLTTELPLLSEFARHIVEFLERQRN